MWQVPVRRRRTHKTNGANGPAPAQAPAATLAPAPAPAPSEAPAAPRQAWAQRGAAPAPAPARVEQPAAGPARDAELAEREGERADGRVRRARRFEYWSPQDNGGGAPRPRKSVLDRKKRADEFSARLRQDQQAKRAVDRAEAAAEVQRLEEKAKQAARRHQAAQEVRNLDMTLLLLD